MSQLLKPSICLECVAGDLTDKILSILSFKSTLILYGGLSEQPASIETINFIGKSLTIEAFNIGKYFSNKTIFAKIKLLHQAQKM